MLNIFNFFLYWECKHILNEMKWKRRQQTSQCRSKSKTTHNDVMKWNFKKLNVMKLEADISHSRLCVCFRRPVGKSNGDHESGDRCPSASGRILLCTPRGLLPSKVRRWRMVSRYCDTQDDFSQSASQLTPELYSSTPSSFSRVKWNREAPIYRFISLYAIRVSALAQWREKVDWYIHTYKHMSYNYLNCPTLQQPQYMLNLWCVNCWHPQGVISSLPLLWPFRISSRLRHTHPHTFSSCLLTGCYKFTDGHGDR